MIIRGGENIYPKEIEEVIYRNPAILDCSIVGFPDKVYSTYAQFLLVYLLLTQCFQIWGEQVAAVIVLRPGKQLQSDELIGYLFRFY